MDRYPTRYTSWWVEFPTHLKKYARQIGSNFPWDRVEHKQIFELPPPSTPSIFTGACRGAWVVHPHQTRCQSFGRSGAVQWYKAKWSGDHLGNHGKIVRKQWKQY